MDLTMELLDDLLRKLMEPERQRPLIVSKGQAERLGLKIDGVTVVLSEPMPTTGEDK